MKNHNMKEVLKESVVDMGRVFKLYTKYKLLFSLPMCAVLVANKQFAPSELHLVLDVVVLFIATAIALMLVPNQKRLVMSSSLAFLISQLCMHVGMSSTDAVLTFISNSLMVVIAHNELERKDVAHKKLEA